jgi:hypothetical protein
MQKLTTGTIIDNKDCVLDFLGIGGALSLRQEQHQLLNTPM